MSPFNLEQALSGKPVRTRDGRKVTSLTIVNGSNDAVSSISAEVGRMYAKIY